MAREGTFTYHEQLRRKNRELLQDLETEREISARWQKLAAHQARVIDRFTGRWWIQAGLWCEEFYRRVSDGLATFTRRLVRR